MHTDRKYASVAAVIINKLPKISRQPCNFYLIFSSNDKCNNTIVMIITITV